MLDHILSGRRIRVRGLVQGVGFRPTVWRLAKEYGVSGQVLNDGEGVLIDAWGIDSQLDRFTQALMAQPPDLARIDGIEQQALDENPREGFHIVESQKSAMRTGVVADAATCSDCKKDCLDPHNRRYRYPFTNCTHCGPRLSIIQSVPYDRSHTSMASFTMCSACQSEYDNPADRRFHAQPNACSVCGPQVWLEPNENDVTAKDDIERAVILLQRGHILAIKGIGGFHLACDATHAQAVTHLRQRKRRYAKPFALMARDIEMICRYCHVDSIEAGLLASVEAPIVLLEKKTVISLAPDVAPEQKLFGFMLPYTPLHHLLLAGLDFPIVMTSANPSDTPQCIDNEQARSELKGIADYWLMHDRDIRNRVDDSVVRVVNHKPQILRRARGHAPASLPLPKGFEHAPDVLAYGGELKNTFCLIKNGEAILSQHMGDLENATVYDDFIHHLDLYQRLFDHYPTCLAVDAHPEYLSSKLGRSRAETEGIQLVEVQHHHAHIAACLVENQWSLGGGKVLGIVMDGLGFSEDGNLWGGEFLLADYYTYKRLGNIKPVALLGNHQAMREPWRNTYAQLVSSFAWEDLRASYSELELLSFLEQKPLQTLDAMIDKGMNAPLASSCGRLFDAVAAAVGLCRDRVAYEGQAAIALEASVTREHLITQEDHAYPFCIDSVDDVSVMNSAPMWRSLLNDLTQNMSAGVIAARFHLGLGNTLATMAQQLMNTGGTRLTDTVVLSGGVFQNQLLFERVAGQLHAAGYTVLTHSQVPANDGGLALGQAAIAVAQQLNNEETLCV
jgi:hydrogenase maturation protein HypF